jgi:hypothetical protein
MCAGEYSRRSPFSGVWGLAIVDILTGKRLAGGGVRNPPCRCTQEIFVTNLARAMQRPLGHLCSYTRSLDTNAGLLNCRGVAYSAGAAQNTRRTFFALEREREAERQSIDR